MPPIRRMGKRTLIFKWGALVSTVVATTFVLLELASDRADSSVFLGFPSHLLPVSQNMIPKTVSNPRMGASLIALGVIVVMQILLLGLVELGRRQLVVAVLIEAGLWAAFGLASYEMLRGYRATVSCSGPPTHCLVTYPSALPSVLVGLGIGIVIGVAWRLSWRADDRAIRRATELGASGSVVNAA